MQKCAKTSPLFAIKHLFCLKTRSKSTFQPMKVCSKWMCLEVSWVEFWVFLCTFMKVQMAFERFFCYFWSILTVFEPFLDLSGPVGAIFGNKMGHFGVILDHFWAFRASFGVTLGWCSHRFGSFWGCFGIVLASVGSFRCRFVHISHFGVFSGHLWANFWAFSLFLGHFMIILRLFGGVLWSAMLTAKLNKIVSEQAKIMQKLPNLCKNVQKQAHKPVVLLKNRRFNLWKYAVSGCVWK